MAVTLTIGGTSYGYHPTNFNLVERSNERNMLSFTVFSLDGSSRPTSNQEVIVTQDGTRIYGGYTEDVEEQLIGGETAGSGLEFHVTCVDFNALADRRFLFSTDFPSQTLKASLQTLITVGLTDYGVTLDGAQVDGPVLPALSYTLQSITEILNALCSAAAALYGTPQAVIWEIDYNRVLRAFGVLESGHTAPFNVTNTTDLFGDTVVRPMKTDYANYIWVLFGATGSVPIIDNLGTGNGVLTSFPLHYFMAANEGYVNVGGSVVGGVITGGVNETLGVIGSGATWTYDPTPYPTTLTRTSAPTGTILCPYIGNFPALVTASSGAALADRVDRVYRLDDIYDYVPAQAFANSMLQQGTMIFKEVIFTTALSGWHPGQTLTITLPKHGLTGTHLITQVRIIDPTETQFWYEVTAISGTGALPESYADTYKLWSKITSGGGGGGTVIVTGPQTKQSFFLGGNATLMVQDPTPTWIPADALRVTIDTNIRGSLTGTAQVRLRASAGNVTARLRNITDGTTAGTSSVVSTVSWTDVSFAVTLAAGAKVYELQVLPSLANTDVAAVGYFE